MARFCSLFSSSSGNSTFIGSAKTGVLIDAGVSAKRMKEALLAKDIDPSQLGGIFVTHEHSDHIKGIRILCSTYKIPLYATEGTLSFLEENGVLNGKFPFEVIDQKGVEVGDIIVRPFTTSHDSRESCGYTIELPYNQKAAIATDLGKITEEVEQAITGCELVMLESNHDISMLQAGPYPYHLKRRILSDKGHLSNEACAEMAKKLIKSGTSRLFLGHLSGENNFPDLAFQTTLSALREIGAENGRDYILRVNDRENTDDGFICF